MCSVGVRNRRPLIVREVVTQRSSGENFTRSKHKRDDDVKRNPDIAMSYNYDVF